MLKTILGDGILSDVQVMDASKGIQVLNSD